MTSARETVEKDYKAVEEAFHKGNADAISRMYTDDAELFIPGARFNSLGWEQVAE